jgi:hypothetical protein
MTDCVIAHNTATNGEGGGVFAGTLTNCLVFANQAARGGGAFNGRLSNCTLTGNSASVSGGGMAGGPGVIRLSNCIVYSNNAPVGANWASVSSGGVILVNSCTMPLPTSGIGNIFLDPASGNLRLQRNSPCIDAGWNFYAPEGPDLDGNPRITGGTVDMGAYEFQSPPYEWLLKFGLPTDGSGDLTDADNDGLNALQEWRAGTDPTNSLSVLRLLNSSANGSGLRLQWQSVPDRTYFLERSSSASGQPAFELLATDIAGQPDTTGYDVTNGAGIGPFFYRVGVKE